MCKREPPVCAERHRAGRGERDGQGTVRFGSYLLLGLEFLIAADITQTVFKPTLTDATILGGIVVIWTVVSYFLNRDIAASRPEA